MSANASTNALGRFLRDRRLQLDPVAFGFGGGRRRTPGLRREEVAQRANISPTWYTWLEQGRGGAPSADVLGRIAAGLMLTESEREHLFLLGLGRPPEAHYKNIQGVTPRLQRVLDALSPTPALIKTATWDVVGWNQAATVFLRDFSALPPGRRNMLRLMFVDPGMREAQEDWNAVARYIVAAFRADAARAGAGGEIVQLVEELSRTSPEFAALWEEGAIAPPGESVKRFKHPQLGKIELEISAFAVDGRTDLSMIVYNPITRETADRMLGFIARSIPPGGAVSKGN
jgi:transcriptional regulator with XRE-family HTH domain